MFLYNVHTPHKTFALTHKDDETRSKLFEKIWSKSNLNQDQKQGTSLLYEFEGERWSLDDDGDLEILFSRFPPSSTPSVTIHVQPPHAHAHFNSPPSYSAPSVSSPSSKIKSKSKKASASAKSAPPSSVSVVDEKPELKVNGKTESKAKANTNGSRSELGVGHVATQRGTNLLAPPVGHSNGIGHKTSQNTAAATLIPPTQAHGGRSVSGAKSVSGQSTAKSVMSTKSRKSKWGDDDAEPLGVTKRREWEEFHNNNGVRTVMGKVNGVPNVRMLLKSGYRHVYVSRNFALKHGLVPKKFSMGSSGYTGLKTIGNVDITVGSRTAPHQAYMSEENHFDVILGRAWLEKMAIKIDPLDPTALTYMDSGEPIPCDIVVLKDDKGNVITVT